MEENARCDAMLIVLDRLKNHLDGNVDALLSKELKTLLKWKGIQVSKIEDKVRIPPTATTRPSRRGMLCGHAGR